MVNTIEILTWGQVRKEVLQVNPELAKIIDNINPDKDHKLIRARYSYGGEILKNTRLQLPDNNGNIVSYDDHRLDKEIKDNLSYCLGSNPVALMLDGQ